MCLTILCLYSSGRNVLEAKRGDLLDFMQGHSFLYLISWTHNTLLQTAFSQVIIGTQFNSHNNILQANNTNATSMEVQNMVIKIKLSKLFFKNILENLEKSTFFQST